MIKSRAWLFQAATIPARSEVRSVLLLLACCAWASAVAPGSAAELKAERVNAAEFSGKQPPANEISPLAVRLQVLLARGHFSPGEIDGKFGENAKKALRAYAEAHQLANSDRLTQDVWQNLAQDDRPVLSTYEITSKDVAGPFLAKLPRKMEDMKHLSRLDYTSAREELAERFHISEELLSALNPGQQFRRAGETIVVVDAKSGAASAAKPDRVEVDKVRQTVTVFDASGQLLDFYPATVGSEEKPSPSGTLKVTSIDHNPIYRYNPKYHFKDVHSKSPFTIKPGPNNPVGTVWINLSAEGYGIHGTPNPGKVSKAASHGCVRVTNWDAEQLAMEVKKGVAVTFVDNSS
jgi:lipoprotein-anchoring transpeptidase ErfK/SrfK